MINFYFKTFHNHAAWKFSVKNDLIPLYLTKFLSRIHPHITWKWTVILGLSQSFSIIRRSIIRRWIKDRQKDQFVWIFCHSLIHFQIIRKAREIIFWSNTKQTTRFLFWLHYNLIISDLVKANEKLYESNNHHSVDLKRFDVDLLTVNSSLVAPDKVYIFIIRLYVILFCFLLSIDINVAVQLMVFDGNFPMKKLRP